MRPIDDLANDNQDIRVKGTDNRFGLENGNWHHAVLDYDSTEDQAEAVQRAVDEAAGA